MLISSAQDAKICFSDDTLPDGFSVRKGDMVAYQPYAMGRMKFIWGDDAEDFRPERWLDENGSFKLESPFKFTAFQVIHVSLMLHFRVHLIWSGNTEKCFPWSCLARKIFHGKHYILLFQGGEDQVTWKSVEFHGTV